jgi:hypothetical protein
MNRRSAPMVLAGLPEAGAGTNSRLTQAGLDGRLDCPYRYIRPLAQREFRLSRMFHS